MKKTAEEDRKYWQEVLDTCNKQPIELTRIIRIAMDNIEKHDLLLPPDEIIWQMAAVMYFDKHESPYKYDEAYGKAKIERWRSIPEVDDAELQPVLASRFADWRTWAQRFVQMVD